MVEATVRELTEKDMPEFKKLFSQTKYSYEVKGSKKILSKKEEAVEKAKDDFMKNFREKATEMDVFNNVMKKSKMFGYFIDGAMAGYCSMETINAKKKFIGEFFVITKGKGYGRDFFEKITQIMKESGVRFYECWSPFEGANHFWKKMGFYEVGEIMRMKIV